MKRKHKATGTANTIPSGVGMGTILSLLITLLGTALTAILVSSETISFDGIGYAVLTILTVSSAAGALFANIRIKRMRVQMCLLTGVCYYLSLLAVTALFFGGQYEGIGAAAVAVLVGSGGAALTNIAGQNKRIRHRRKMQYR